MPVSFKCFTIFNKSAEFIVPSPFVSPRIDREYFESFIVISVPVANFSPLLVAPAIYYKDVSGAIIKFVPSILPFSIVTSGSSSSGGVSGSAPIAFKYSDATYP